MHKEIRDKNANPVSGIIGIILIFLPVILMFAFEYTGLFLIAKDYSKFSSKKLLGAIFWIIQNGLIYQLISMLLLLPGLVFCSIATFAYKYKRTWYFVFLRIYAFLMLLSFPIYTFVSIYVFILAKLSKPPKVSIESKKAR